MTEKDLKRLSRADLLEMLIDQSLELQTVQKKLQQAEAELSRRAIALDEAGNIAEAALRLNGVFEAAQASCEQYMENIRMRNEHLDEICSQREAESMRRAAAMISDAEQRCAEMEEETRRKCDQMLLEAQTDAAVYWEDVHRKLRAFCAQNPQISDQLKGRSNTGKRK